MPPNYLLAFLILTFLFICVILTSSIISLILFTNKQNENLDSDLFNQNRQDIKVNQKLLLSLSENFKFNKNIESNNQTSIFECSSSIPISSRILNGIEATPNNYPWMVSLRLLKNQNLYDHFCAGVLVSNQLVITAAHCVNKQQPNELLAVFGLYYRTDISKNILDNTYSVSKIVLHENNTENDIALLILNQPVRLSTNIIPICLPFDFRPEFFYGYEVSVIGWGLKGLKEPSRKLQETKMTIINNKDPRCLIHLKDKSKNNLYCALQTKNFDLKNSNNDTQSTICSGDSGGPLFIKYNNKWLLLGIVSFVQTYVSPENNNEYLCDPSQPSFYSNVPFYINWINSTSNNLNFNN